MTRHGVRIIGAYFPARVDLSAGHLPWQLWIRESRFESELRLNRLQVDRRILLIGSFVGGWLRMVSASIGGSLSMRNATFVAIDLAGARVGDQLSMRNVTVTGTLIVEQAKIGGNLFMDRRATFAGVDPNSMTVGLNLSLAGGTFNSIDLSSATIAGELRLAQGKRAIRWSGNANRLVLRNASVDAISLPREPEAWPASLELEGFTYKKLGGLGQDTANEMTKWPADTHKKWLERNDSFTAQPYEQLASVLRAAGAAASADAVLFAGKDRERVAEVYSDGKFRNHVTAEQFLKHTGLTVLQYGVGFGIELKTFRVLGWAFAVVLLGWGVLVVNRDRQTLTDGFAGPIGFWFSLDYLLPIVRLRNAHFENVELGRGVREYFYVHQIVGYVLVFFAIAGLSGIAK